MVIDQYIYLNNLINICFINYFLYIKFKEIKIYFSHPQCIFTADLTDIYVVEPECDFVTFSGGNGSCNLFLKSKCSTDELCHCANLRPTMLLQHTCSKFSKILYFFEVGLLLVGLFNRLFMTKCENKF